MSEQLVATTHETTPESLQGDVLNALELDKEGFESWKDQFIRARLAELEHDSYQGGFDGFIGSTDKFFSPKAEIKPLFIGRGFVLDDEQIYHRLLDTAYDFHSGGHMRGSENYRQLIVQSTQYGLQNYFGNVAPSHGDQAMREERLWESGILSNDDSVPAPTSRSISDNKTEALCSERAAVAHNMLRLMGWDSTYYVGKLSIGDTDADLHAFVIYKNSKGESVIYDPMNPEMVVDGEDKLIQTHPAAYEGGDEIIAGNPVVVSHKRHRMHDGKHSELDHRAYRYFSNPLIAMRA